MSTQQQELGSWQPLPSRLLALMRPLDVGPDLLWDGSFGTVPSTGDGGRWQW